MVFKSEIEEVQETSIDNDTVSLKGLTGGVWKIKGLGGQDLIEGGDGINFISGDASWGILNFIETKETTESVYKHKDHVLNSTEIDDDIIGGNGINIIHAGLNNDKIQGGAGINLMQFKVGDGDDTVLNSNGTDYLYFCDCSPEETRLSRKGDDLVIEYGRMKEGSDLVVDYNSSVTVKDYFKTGAKPSLKGIGFSSELSQFRIDLAEIENILKNEDITIQTLQNAITNAFKNSATVSGLIDLQSPENSFKIEMTTPGSVTGTGGNDDIKGSAGLDIINGGTGDDIITGGKGDDKLYGGSGTNTFIFNEGDGKDTIYYQNGTDILDLTSIQNSANITSYKEKNDLIIKYSEADEIRLADYFKNKGKADIKLKVKEAGANSNIQEAVKNLKDFIYVENDFSNEIKGKTIVGSIINDRIIGTTKNDVIKGGDGDDIIYGNLGNDKLYGEGGKNTFVFNKEDGQDIVYSGKGEDTIKFEGIEGIETNGVKNVKFSAKGNNLIINYGNGDTVTVVNYLANPAKSSVKFIQFKNSAPELISDLLDKYPFEFDGVLNKKNSIKGTNSKDIITGGDLNETLSALNGDDIVYAGAGNDVVRGGNGNDTIYGEDGNDKLYGDNGDDVIYGGAGNDIIYGGNGNDEIYGGTGDDKLYGISGDNTFHFSKGDGKDIVYIGKGSDTLYFHDIGFSDLTYSLGKSNALTINYRNGDSVDIAAYFSKKGKVSVKKIVTKDGEKTLDEIVNDKDFKVLIDGVLDKKNTLRGTYKNDILTGGNLNDTILGNDGDDIIFGGAGNDLLRGGNGNDTIYGGVGNDRLYGDNGINTFVFNKGDGQDTIYSGKGQDTIKFEGIEDFDPKTMYFSAKGNNLIINYGNGDSIKVVNYLANPAKSSVQHIQFEGKEPVLISELIKAHPFEFYGTDGKKNSIRGTNTTDIIKGGNLNDTIVALGGDDVISAGDGADVVRGGDGNDLIFGEGGNDKLYGDNGNDTIYGGTGDDIIYGGNGDDIIFGEAGNDRLYGDAGNNTFYFREGDGKDTIYMNAKGSDTLVFDTNLKDTLIFDRVGNNLVINYGTKGDSVTIVNYLSSKNPSTKNIVFADYDAPKGDFSKTEGILLSDILIKKEAVKFQLDTGKLVNGEYYKGNAYNNLIISTGAYSEIDAGAGDDILYLQSKNVTAFGGAGDDKYVVSSLANNTTIKDTEGSNTVKILDKKTNVKVLFDVKISNGEIVNSADDSDSLLILNNAAFNKVKSTGKLNTATGIKIDDFSSAESVSGNAPVQKIETNNGYLDISALESIRQDVAGWLGNNGYTSAMYVLDGGNKADIQSLLAIYQTTDTKWV